MACLRRSSPSNCDGWHRLSSEFKVARGFMNVYPKRPRQEALGKVG